MLEAKSPSEAWKVMTDCYAPKSKMEKRRVAQEFDSISMVEGEDHVEYLSRVDKRGQKPVMPGGTKDDDDGNVHIIQTLTASYDVEKNILLSSPGLTRSNNEEVVRNAFMSHKQNFGKGKGQTKGDDPHVLYAGGAQPDGAGGNGMGRDSNGKQKNRQETESSKTAGAAAVATATAAAASAAAPSAAAAESKWWLRCSGHNQPFRSGIRAVALG